MGLIFCAFLTVKVEKIAWNRALMKASEKVIEQNYFAGLDDIYDRGYERCQERSLEKISELRRE